LFPEGLTVTLLPHDLRNFGHSGAANGGIVGNGLFEYRDVVGSLKCQGSEGTAAHDYRALRPLLWDERDDDCHDEASGVLRGHPVYRGAAADFDSSFYERITEALGTV
jgi:hypothetical protein